MSSATPKLAIIRRHDAFRKDIRPKNQVNYDFQLFSTGWPFFQSFHLIFQRKISTFKSLSKQISRKNLGKVHCVNRCRDFRRFIYLHL